MSDELTSTAEKLMKLSREREVLSGLSQEQAETYKRCLNDVASTESGRYFIRSIINWCGVFIAEENASPDKRYKDSIKRELYIRSIRPFLEKDLRNQIEG